MSSVITISQPPTVPGDRSQSIISAPPEMLFAPLEVDEEPSGNSSVQGDGEDSSGSGNGGGPDVDQQDDEANEERKAKALGGSLAKLEGDATPVSPLPSSGGFPLMTTEAEEAQSVLPDMKKSMNRFQSKRRRRTAPEGVIVLREERVSKRLSETL